MVKRLPATVTVIYEAYCQKMGLEVQPINALVKLVGTSGSPIPYSGYLIATVKFPHIQNYEEDVVMLVIRDKTKWADSVPIQIGTRVITAVTEQIRPEDLQSIADTWKQTYMGNLMACAVKGHRDDGDNFSLDSVKGPVKLKKAVELEPLGQTEVWGYTQVTGHSRMVAVCTESEDLLMQDQAMSINTKTDLLPHSSKVKVLLRNLTSKSIKIPAKVTIGNVTPCNVVPAMWNTEESPAKQTEDTWGPELETLFDNLGLNEKKDWMTEEEVIAAKSWCRSLR